MLDYKLYMVQYQPICKFQYCFEIVQNIHNYNYDVNSKNSGMRITPRHYLNIGRGKWQKKIGMFRISAS